LFLAALKVTLVTSAIFELQPSLSFENILGKRALISFFRLREEVYAWWH
jgi:hypothetical protein